MNYIEEYNHQYYKGYLLDDTYEWDLTDKEKMILDNACMLVDEHYTLKELSRNCCRSVSSLKRDFGKPLRSLSFELWQCVNRVKQENLKEFFH